MYNLFVKVLPDRLHKELAFVNHVDSHSKLNANSIIIISYDEAVYPKL
jgi:hypothetical protein